jgi:hypothetical protein
MFAYLAMLRQRNAAKVAKRRPRQTRRNCRLPAIESLEHRDLLAITNFAIVGDFGNNSSAEASVASMIKGWSPDFITTVGDNNYGTTSGTYDPNVGQYYHEYIGNYTGSYGAGSATNRFFPALGNHDWDLANGQEYLSFFTLPGNERYYDFVKNNIHFFVIDSDTREPSGTSSTSTQAQWLQSKLAASTSEFNVVLFHHAPYSSGSHGGTAAMRWPFKQWGADVVLTGHDHIYERLNIDGLPYFVDGVGGASLTTVSAPTAGSQFYYTGHYGAIKATADTGYLTFEFYAVDRSGTPVDRLTISSSAPAPTPTQTLIGQGSTWKYLDTGVDAGTAWRAVSYSDTAWKSGPAQLGYGDGDERTIVSYGPNASNKYKTTYFRKAFSVTDPAQFSGLKLNLLRDDGAVVYLNGTEVYRTNMPTGTVSSATLAMTAIGGADESAWYSANINPSLLRVGTNLLSVEIHQANVTSTDISFDASLVATLGGTTGAPGLSVSDVRVSEGNTGSTPAVFNVRLSSTSSQYVYVAYATANGTAAAGSDFTGRSGTLTFAPGTTLQSVTVSVFGDANVEADETFYFNLSSPTGATISDGQAQAVIANDDSTTTTQTFIAQGATWKYLDTGVDAGTAWRSVSYSDTAWKSGPAQLGYGDGDERTVVSYGPNASNKYKTTYFRRAFSVADPTKVTGLTLNLLRDDGAVVYLNGTEVYRTNMPTGTVSYSTLATTALGGADESAWYSASISPSLLRAGTNVLAVEIHQANVTSTDISFDASLVGRVSSSGTLAASGLSAPAEPISQELATTTAPSNNTPGLTSTSAIVRNTKVVTTDENRLLVSALAAPLYATERVWTDDFVEELEELTASI